MTITGKLPGSLILKRFDWLILILDSDKLTTDEFQFGFQKPFFFLNVMKVLPNLKNILETLVFRL